MATSTVPAAVDALLAILRASAALSAVTVVDGPPTTSVAGPDHLFIGWQPGSEAAVTLQQDFNAAGARTRDEQYDIVGYAESRTGDLSMSISRTRVFEVIAALEGALRATEAAPAAPTLNGTVQWAHLTTGNFAQIQTNDGPVAGLAFTIHCRARI